MEIILNGPKVTMHLQVNGKFNVIVGESGTGKSYLCELVEEMHRLLDYKNTFPVPVCSGVRAVKNLALWAEQYRGAVLILDERSMEEFWRNEVGLMKESHNYYIICARDGDARIPYGVDTTFNIVRTQTALHMVPAYKDVGLKDPHGFSSVLTEDEGVGHDVASRLASVPVSSAQGKDK